jgi:hypothetical protein
MSSVGGQKEVYLVVRAVVGGLPRSRVLVSEPLDGVEGARRAMVALFLVSDI